MFRKPRDFDATPDIKVSTGRPPTPPNAANKADTMTTRSSSTKTTLTRTSSTKPLTPRPNSKINVSVSAKNSVGGTIGQANGSATVGGRTPGGKTPAKPNGSILNFFKKVEGPPRDEEGLFMPQIDGGEETSTFNGRSLSPNIYEADHVDENGRYNELGGSVKRRRLSSVTATTQVDEDDVEQSIERSYSGSSKTAIPKEANIYSSPPSDTTITKNPKARRIWGFIYDSDCEDEDVNLTNGKKTAVADETAQEESPKAEKMQRDTDTVDQSPDLNNLMEACPLQQNKALKHYAVDPEIARIPPLTVCYNNDQSEERVTPTLEKEGTIYDDYEAFDSIDDFLEDDEFAGGEEFEERKWMEEQARLEAAEQGETLIADETTFECPICEGNLEGLADHEASRHVNACLDGNPIPIPEAVKSEPKEVKMMPPGAGSRFSRAAIARPGQANPFEIGNVGRAPVSAFSKLMSSHAEDAAWASAAAAENAARGKAAYQRTCPFYKIMPGFFICVDAFRYGAVQGCKAYFLSHFHSDHYIGLTSTWCHGPIYCSKVTANLVRQQLRVDSKWVVALDFEEIFDVPGTDGVAVTMIPANHCPGSSLFLFEKIIGKGANPKIQRVLHCGDFRACPAHVEHPLLMPEIVDSITGKTKQQKIDVCYLDTTYLNPKYSFPSQEDVIKSCADMCVSLSKEKAEESDAWEVVKKERAGAGMVKFVGSAVNTDDSIAMEVGSTKTRGKLLVVCGTYSIGKERICMGIARALDCKIWAPPGKQRICAALEDPELSSRLTDDPRKAQIHMQMLMEIRAETLQDYLNGFKPHYSRIVGFRPSGWNYRPPNSRFLESPSVHTVLTSENWRSRYSMTELVPQRGSTKEASCFGVPYSEHSSFRELTLFCCALRIEKIIPTVNVGSAASRAKMKTWIDRWLAERRKNGLVKIGHGTGQVRW